MFLCFNDSEEICTKIEYDSCDNLFLLKNELGDTVCEYNPTLELDSEYDPQHFQYQILYNNRSDYSEDCIYQVYDCKVRMGWIFPLQALLSNLHNYSNNKYFLKYAYVAIYLLLNDVKATKDFPINARISLEEFFDSTCTVLLIDNENTSKIKDFDLAKYTISLYQNGYSYYGNGNLDSDIEKPDKKLHLKQISGSLKNIDYIYDLFKNLLPLGRTTFEKFHLNYQIIELLIGIVFENKFKIIIKKLTEDSSDSLYDQRNALNEIITEKNRVKWLFHDYVKISHDKENALNEECIRLLEENNQKNDLDVADNLYRVRCLLVHNMYIFNERSFQLLKGVNIAFLDVVIEMLLTFKLLDES